MGMLMGINSLSFRNNNLTDNISGIYIQELISPPWLINNPTLIKVMLFLRIFLHNAFKLLRFPRPAYINGILRIDYRDILQIIGHHKLTVTLIQHGGIGAFIHYLIPVIPLNPCHGQVLQTADILPPEGAVNHLSPTRLFKHTFFYGNCLDPLKDLRRIIRVPAFYLTHIKSGFTRIIKPWIKFPDFLYESPYPK